MVGFKELRRKLSDEFGLHNGCVQACHKALSQAPFDEVGPGRLLAAAAVGIFEVREQTARSAGIGVDGMRETLAALRALEPKEEVLLFHFSGATEVFTMFVRERDAEILGCVHVVRDRRLGGASGDWSDPV